ncbi:MAG: transcription termination/antitermination NusG family protein [Rectinema sp.]
MQYFAIQVRTTHEDEYAHRAAVMRPDIVVHVLKKKLMIRKKGKLVPEMSCLFPGYVIIEQEDDGLSLVVKAHLRSTTGFVRFLPETTNPKPFNAADVQIIHRFVSLGGKIGLSKVVFDENDRIKVLEGPLMGLEGRIIKVDRRKHRIKIRLDMYSDMILFDLGYDLVVPVDTKSAPAPNGGKAPAASAGGEGTQT